MDIALNGFDLPRKVEWDNQYYPKLVEILDQYYEVISGIDDLNDNVIQNTKENIELIKGCIKCYYNADIVEAKNKICAIIRKYMNNEFIVNELNKSYSFRGLAPYENLTRFGTAEQYEANNSYPLSFYKARVGENSFSRYNKKEMLHIPFNMRGYINTQRFSIPGIPCLYFGTSSYVCWEELDRPEINRFNVASYRLPGSIKILNLTIDQVLIDALASVVHNEHDLKLIQALLEMWPLVCATSFKVNEQNRKFRSEYIISQIIMQCMQEMGVDGVAYYSKRVEINIRYPWICTNLAILAKCNQEPGSEFYSEICRGIDFTETLNAGEFQIMPPTSRRAEQYAFWYNLNGSEQTVKMANEYITYKDTIFGEMDNYLASMHHENIDIDA